MRSATLAERIWSRIDRGPDDACWPWTGWVNRYTSNPGSVVVNNGAKLKAFTPRRYIYETCIGPLDRKQVVVMSCENARCLNPAHMVTVFRGGQMRRIPVTTDIEFNPDGLRALREQWGMTQATLAELCGVVPDMVRRWERGQCPSGTLLLRIIAALSRNPHAHFRTDQVLQRLMRKTQMATEDKHA